MEREWAVSKNTGNGAVYLMDDEKKVMLREIELQPKFLRDNAGPMVERLVESVQGIQGDVEHLYVVGCGDSYYAAEAARQFLTEMTGLHVESMEALEFSRYLASRLPKHSAVIGISNSGTVSRTVEAIMRARARGAFTFAVTTSHNAPLAQAAAVPLIINSPPNIKERIDGPPVVTPGTLTYTASLLGVYSSAIALGVRCGLVPLDQLPRAVQQLLGVADAMEDVIKESQGPAREYAASLSEDRRVIIVGGGPNYGTARFGVAKLYEALQFPAFAAEMEEWAHEEFFITDERADVVVICPPGANCRDRAIEQMRAAREMGARVIALCSSSDGEATAYADRVFSMPAGIAESLTPFVYSVPFQYVACWLAHTRGAAFLGFDDTRRREVNFRQIFGSVMVPLAAAE